MATRISAAVVVVCVVALGVATVVGVRAGRELGRDLVEDSLVSARTSAELDVAAHVASLTGAAVTLALSPRLAEAVPRLSAGLDELGGADAEVVAGDVALLADTYRDDYLGPLRLIDVDVQLTDLLPVDVGAIRLQAAFVSGVDAATDPTDGEPISARSIVDPAVDGDWAALHRELHLVYRSVADRLDLVDLVVVDADARVIYTVEKRPDLGTSLSTGPFSGSVLDATASSVLDDGAPVVSDLSEYLPAGVAPVGLVGAPIETAGRVVGAVVLIYRADDLTRVVTADQSWEAAGLPDGSDVYLVGADGSMRSEPRGFLEEPVAFLQRSVELGDIEDDDRAAIVGAGSTVLRLPARDQTVGAGRDGDVSVVRRPGVTGTASLSTTIRVPIEGPEWYVVAELAGIDADAGLEEFEELLVIGAAIFVVLLAFAAVAWATAIVRPVRSISDRLGEGGRFHEPVEMSAKSPIEFADLADGFASMSATLAAQQADLERAYAERLRVLTALLPPAEVERALAGGEAHAESIAQASAVVLVLDELDRLLDLDGPDGGVGRDRLDRIHGGLDEVAAEHGLRRIKVVGDAYFAVCGLDTPYIDHAPRAVAFAVEAARALREIGAVAVEVGAAVHSGPVTAGTTGPSGLLYDVWGESITIAHALARRARPGELLVSDSVRSRLPQADERLVPVDADESIMIWSVRVEPTEVST